MINERASKLRKQNLHVLQFLQESVAAKCQYHQVTSHAIRIAKKNSRVPWLHTPPRLLCCLKSKYFNFSNSPMCFRERLVKNQYLYLILNSQNVIFSGILAIRLSVAK
jgi:hypothetical protein